MLRSGTAANDEVARYHVHRPAILAGAHMCNCLIHNLSDLELSVLTIPFLTTSWDAPWSLEAREFTYVRHLESGTTFTKTRNVIK